MTFHLYGLFIGLGILVAVEISEQARKLLAIGYKRYASFSVWQGFLWVIVPAILGARLYHIFDFWSYYSQFPEKIVATWEGGMGIWGGIIGGTIGLMAYALVTSWREVKGQDIRKLDIKKFREILPQFLAYSDLAVVGLPLGQAIGRLGNFLNQELYGLPTNLPWGIYILPENRLADYERYSHFHPLFAYEAVWDLIIFIIVLAIIKIILKARRRIFQPGLLFFTYLGLYGLGRFFLEFLRIGPWRWGALTAAQWLSLVAISTLVIYSTRVFLKGNHE